MNGCLQSTVCTRLAAWVAFIPLILGAMTLLSGCDDPQVYGSVGVSSGYGSYCRYGGGYRGGYGNRAHTSISVGGRIR
jgi:hypothetical protein